MDTAHTGHLLLVDDDEEILQTMSIIFEMNGYTLRKAQNGKEALALLEDTDGKRIDLIITDIEMPVMNGLEFVRTCKKIKCDVPILVVTGHGTKNMVVELMREGVTDFIDKPLQMRNLLEHTQNCVEKFKAREKTRAAAIQKQIKSIRTEYEERILASQEFEILGKMACGVIHDFNNVLAGIMGYADIMYERINKNPGDECAHYAAKIIKATETAQRIVDQFQAFKKGGEEEFVDLDMHEVIREAVGMVRVPLREKVSAVTELHAERSGIKGDRALLHNALINLLFNARDAMEEKGTVSISTELMNITDSGDVNATALSITVEDTGCGMTKETMEKVFEPFYTTKGKAGNGIGLSSVLSIVEQHGGAISVDSEVGKGTTFTIILPLAE